MRYALALLIFFAPALSQAQTPAQIGYQGYLTDGGGTPINAPTDLVVKLFTAASAGTEVWTRTFSATPVTEGVFALILENGTPSLSTVAFDRPLWVQVAAGGQVLTPRTKLTMAPSAQSLVNLRVQPETATGGPNMIGGWTGNTVSPGVEGATIAGGGDPDHFGISRPNSVSAQHGTIGGGLGNEAGEQAAIGGGIDNAASGIGSTVGGGNANAASGIGSTVGGGNANAAGGTYSVVGGGESNAARFIGATVGGGSANQASGGRSTVGGGILNFASGNYATVPGGSRNQARGDYSLAAGYKARAAHDGSFVWNDRSVTSDNDSLVSTGSNQFLIRAAGGVGIGTNDPTSSLHVVANSDPPTPHLILEETDAADFARMRLKNQSNTDFWGIVGGGANNGEFNLFHPARSNVLSLRSTGDPLVMYNGAKLTAGGAWTNASSVHLKQDFEDVDTQALLRGIAGLAIQEWSYKTTPDVRHVGPTAQEFYAAFGLGNTDEGIATVDADGVALAAIQALIEQNRQQEQRIANLERELARILDLLNRSNPSE